MGAVIAFPQKPREIYRTRVPLECVNPATGLVERGFADTWTADKSRADARAAATSGAFVQALTMADILEFEPAAQLKARAAWANAFPDA